MFVINRFVGITILGLTTYCAVQDELQVTRQLGVYGNFSNISCGDDHRIVVMSSNYVATCINKTCQLSEPLPYNRYLTLITKCNGRFFCKYGPIERVDLHVAQTKTKPSDFQEFFFTCVPDFNYFNKPQNTVQVTAGFLQTNNFHPNDNTEIDFMCKLSSNSVIKLWVLDYANLGGQNCDGQICVYRDDKEGECKNKSVFVMTGGFIDLSKPDNMRSTVEMPEATIQNSTSVTANVNVSCLPLATTTPPSFILAVGLLFESKSETKVFCHYSAAQKTTEGAVNPTSPVGDNTKKGNYEPVYSTTQTIVIAGSVSASAGVLIVLSVVIACVIYRRKRQQISEENETELTDNPVYEGGKTQFSQQYEEDMYY